MRQNKNPVQINVVKKSSLIIKLEISFKDLLFTVDNLLSDTDNLKDSTDSVLQCIFVISGDNIKETFFRLVVILVRCLTLKSGRSRWRSCGGGGRGGVMA